MLYLGEKEKRVLASLYKLADCSVSNIAKDTLINRTTLYPILENLFEKGLISKVKTEGKALYQPISSDDFKIWADRKEKEFKNTNESLEKWIKNQTKSEKLSLISETRYFEGREGVESLYADTWRENNEKLIRAITDYKGAYKTLGDFFRNEYFPARVKHGVRVKNLIPESIEARKDLPHRKEFLRDMKLIKLFKDLNIEINIYDSKVAIVAFDKKRPSGVIIKNEIIAKAMKNIFEYLWKTAS